MTSSTPEPLSLKKELKLRQLFSLAFGTIIGVGWITVLGEWLLQAGSLGAVLGFAAGGFVMILIGLTYAEMAGMFPVSGGEVAYAYEAFGLKTSFLTGWLLALSYIGVVSFEVISVGWVVCTIFPGLEGPVLYSYLGDEVSLGSVLIGLTGTAVVTFFNYRGARMAATFQDLLVLGLLVISAIFIAVGLWGGDASYLKPLFVREGGSGWIWGGVVTVFATTPFWYSGFDTIPQAMGEKAEGAPLRLVGRVVVLAIGVAILFYCLVIVSAAMTLPRATLVSMELPTAAAFEAAFNSPLLGRMVLFAGLLGLVSSWNAFFFAGSRVLFALGRSRILPSFFGTVQPLHRSPLGAVLFVGVVSAVSAFLGRSAIIPIVNTGGSCLSVVFLLTCIGVLQLRRVRPDAERPYRVPGLPIIILAVVGSLSVLILSLYQPYANAQGGIPLEWKFFVFWGLLGALFWKTAEGIRKGVTEKQRRALMLGGEE